MIAQNAPEADIDAYAQSEGTTPEALRAFGQQAETHILRDDSSPPLNDIFRLRKGGRPILDFADGTCSLLGWRDGNGQSLRNIAR